jgi:hypothetical protein
LVSPPQAHDRIGRKISPLDGPLADSSGTAVPAMPRRPHKIWLQIDWYGHTADIPWSCALSSFGALTALSTHATTALHTCDAISPWKHLESRLGAPVSRDRSDHERRDAAACGPRPVRCELGSNPASLRASTHPSGFSAARVCGGTRSCAYGNALARSRSGGTARPSGVKVKTPGICTIRRRASVATATAVMAG